MSDRLLNDAEKRDFLRGGTIRRGPHKFTRRILHWPYCAGCGLVLLRNEPTAKAARAQCQWED